MNRAPRPGRPATRTTRLLMTLVRAYQVLLSPALGARCRFDPSCSAYTFTALQRHGAAAGVYLGARRILRCHPWCAGGADPVPERPPKFFHRQITDPSSP